MRFQHCPPISVLTTPYTSTPLPHLLLGLQSLRSCGALKLCLRRCPHPPYASSHLPLTILTLVECLPDMPPTPLNTLVLVQCPTDLPPTPPTLA
ncbi:hypothetical protein O181_034278 [Austropuccinia psidii MF-1]|uniref:Uncharacterized protein n=1 Tax=Austropuccinia psidii MF-1 TaxID=1389203 RepID=A0A9Q3D557_9BASI|nr:hypothetical protein [Austropuccinia psidii MF-1]